MRYMCTQWLVNIALHVYFLTNPDVVTCYDGEVRLGYSDMEGSGFLEVCYQGNWISVCLNSAYNTNTSQLAELACRSIVGFVGV